MSLDGPELGTELFSWSLALLAWKRGGEQSDEERGLCAQLPESTACACCFPEPAAPLWLRCVTCQVEKVTVPPDRTVGDSVTQAFRLPDAW